MRGTRVLSVLLLGFATSCGGRSEPPPSGIPLPSVVVLSEAEGFGIAARLSFNDRSAWFVLDTGAGVHTLAQWFVEAAGMPVDGASGGVSGRDATGAAMDLRMVRDQRGTFEGGITLSVPVAAVAAFPPEFEEAGIGGLINPQLLASQGQAVVLDLRESELRMEPFDAAVRRLGATAMPANQLRVCRSTAVDVPYLLFGLLVQANGEEGWLQLDTGAKVTKLARESRLVEGLVLETGGQAMGVAGELQEYQRARDLTLTVGGYEVRIDAQVAAASGDSCGPDGLLGLDVVGRCALIMSQDQLALACEE